MDNHVHHGNLIHPVLTMYAGCFCLNMIFEMFKMGRIVMCIIMCFIMFIMIILPILF